MKTSSFLLLAAGVLASGCTSDELVDWRGAPRERVWTALQPMPVTQGLAATVDRKGAIFVISGGSCGGAYDGVSFFDTGEVRNDGGTYMSANPMPRAAASAVVIDGDITVVGGCNAGEAMGSVQTYDFFSAVWSNLSDMPTARYGTAIGAIDRTIYVAGGADSTEASLDTFEKLESGVWTSLPALPRARQFAAGAVLDGKLYVIGGMNSSGTMTYNDVDIYDPMAGEWTSGRPMPTGRATGAVALDGVIFVVSGLESGIPVATVQIYDPFYDVWSAAPEIPTPRFAAQPVAIGSKLYVAGNVAPGEKSINAFEALVPTDSGDGNGNGNSPGTWSTTGMGGCTDCGGPPNNDGGGGCSVSLGREAGACGWVCSIAALIAGLVAQRRRRTSVEAFTLSEVHPERGRAVCGRVEGRASAESKGSTFRQPFDSLRSLRVKTRSGTRRSP